jgi:hypothetical protein
LEARMESEPCDHFVLGESSDATNIPKNKLYCEKFLKQ